LLSDSSHTKWRNKVFEKATGSKLQAIVAFGDVAKKAVSLWTGKGSVPVFETFHPSYRGPESNLTADWNRVITALRAIITKDSDGDNTAALYGTTFNESDYTPIPRRDFPFGTAEFLGNDSWLRTSGSGQNSVTRPAGDDFTITWKAPNN